MSIINHTSHAMTKTAYAFIYGCLFFLSVPLQAKELNFSQISSRNGLSQNTVRAIAEDKNGFIWAGTLDGLNRYDGYNIRSYQPRIGNPGSLGDHRVRDLFVDKNGYLWVKTYRNEFSCYNPASDSFIHIYDEKGEPLTYTSYYESSRGDVWLWDRYNGVIRLRKKTGHSFDQTVVYPKQSPRKACYFLYEDPETAIWIGGEEGLIRVGKNDSITTYYTGGENYTFTQAVELNDKIYFSTKESTLVVYDRKGKSFEEISYGQKGVFGDMARLTQNELLITSPSLGILLFDTSSRRFRRSELSNDKELTGNMRLIVDKNQGVWLYNHTGMVWYYNRERQTVKKMRLISEDIANMIDLERYTLLVDSDNLIWITTYGNGLFCYDSVNDKLTNYKNEPDPNSLASDFLLSITEDRFGNIWIGSEYAGMIRIVKAPDYVRIIRPERNAVVGKTNNVRTICEDVQGNIWVGTKNGSLYVYNPGLTNGKCIGENLNPYSLVEDKKQRMWIGTKGNGLYLYDAQTFREIAHYRYQEHNPVSLSNDVIFQIMKDSKDRMWIGSFGGGLSLVEEHGNTLSFKRFLQGKGNRSLIRCLYQDSKGMIWAGGSDGVIRFDPEELINDPEAYISYRTDTKQAHSLSSNDIKIIYEDKRNTIWIGTAGGGLNKFVEATADKPEHFISYTMNDGMPDNYVLGILEHGDDLWISSENGLSRFSRANGLIVTYQFAQKSYGNIFNEGAYCQCRDGNMLWGSLDGLLAFNPKKFHPDTHVPPVLLTRLQVDGADWNDIKPETSDKSITYTDKIKLSYKQNTFSIEFATLTLRNPEKNKYIYILENYDKGWSIPTHSNTATYKNLPHGKYIFKVKGANSDGVWNEEIKTLEISITPPFWKSMQAYIIYFMLAASLLYVVFRLIVKFARLNNAVEVEKQLTNHKLRFFTNISHEFRTPLTLIRGAIENLNEEGNLSPSVTKQLHVLSRNSSNLTRLIDQLLEFRKLQNDVLTLDLEEVDIVDFARDIYFGFQELAGQKNIRYTFAGSTESLRIFIDRKKVDKIVYNLLSNAFKFTPKGGLIEFTLVQNEKDGTCILSVKDNGAGIPKEKQHLLFSRFTQINFSSSGTGIGLSLVKEFVDVHKGKVSYESNPTGGSIFTVELSTRKDTYKGENFVTFSHPDVITEASHVAMPDILSANETFQIDQATLADYKILIIDDNDDIRNFLVGEFSKYFAIDVAEDGEEGLQKAIDDNPDLIICDVMMPRMDGFEVTRRLKNEFQTCHIPIILLTAHSSVEHQLEGIESGADAYITKPFSLKYVVKRVMKLIEQREQLKKRFSKEFVIDGNLIATDKDKTFFELIEKILEKNYEDSAFTVDKFAELSNTRRTVFFKKVKGITGFSPNELIKIKRLNASAILLRKGELTISEISYKVGFEDPYYFSKCFKAQFNCTPSKYGKSKDDSSKI